MSSERNDEKKLSKNKENFLGGIRESNLIPDPYPLLAEDLPVLVKHYWHNKGNIPLLINGCTPRSKALIEEKKNKYIKILSDFKKYPLATYIVNSWVPTGCGYFPKMSDIMPVNQYR
jgi:hypothetical protein